MIYLDLNTQLIQSEIGSTHNSFKIMYLSSSYISKYNLEPFFVSKIQKPKRQQVVRLSVDYW